MEEEESDKLQASISKEKPSFSVDVSAIETVHKEQQASELQSLDLDVYDLNTLEQGIIAQVEEAIHKRNADDLTSEETEEPPSKLRRLLEKDETKNEIKSVERNLTIEKYFQDQARLCIKKSNDLPPKKKIGLKGFMKVTKSPKEYLQDEHDKEFKKNKKGKGKFLGTKIRKKKEKLGTKKGSKKGPPALQPGEKHHCYLDGSDSEYLPSSDESEEEYTKTVKKKSNSSKISKNFDSDHTDDSDWASDDEFANKRKKGQELDDGDLDIFSKRINNFDKSIYNERHIIEEGEFYKCPKVIWDKLYKYQQDAVAWFWELNKERCGGILGDEMGLGKTIQLIAFLAGLYVSNIKDFDTDYTGLGPTLIVCPTTLMHQWVREFHKWLPPVRVAILHESGTYTGKNKRRLVDSVHNHDYGVLITSYNSLVMYKDKILSKHWHYVVLDEGHKIRNHVAQVTLVAKQLLTPHRIILSGSPLQNNLKELWSLFDFIYPGKLGTLNVFIASFQTPILVGGYANASQFQVKTAYKCAVILKETITPYLLRRMKSEVDHHINLPPKTEQVLFCKLSDIQREYYKYYIDNVDLEGMARGKVKVFVGLINLRKICNHPDLYSGGPNKDFQLSKDTNNNKSENRFGYYERAGKMIVIHNLLKIWFQQKHRVLIFTQSKKMLLILEDYIKIQDYKYLKLDGQTSISLRQPLIDQFNSDSSYFVMLLTTKVGGLGVNLTGANRVIIYDPDWNPATDTQARERAWRIGQERDVTIYRLITAGTIEEKMYHRQIFKQFLCNKVLKDPRQRRFFKSNDLLELFTLSETVKGGTNETAAIFAGTGSEVQLKKPVGKLKDAIVVPQHSFSSSKIEEMRKLAQTLNKKFANGEYLSKNKNDVDKNGKETIEPIPSTSKQEIIYGPDGNLALTSVNTVHEKENNIPQSNGTINNVHKKKKKSSTTFEGHFVPHLIKCKSVKKKKKIDVTLTQDEYVLQKLFSKSDVHTVLKHDTIMNGGPSDFVIVEDEAEQIAQDALKKVAESSAQVAQVRKTPFITPRSVNESSIYAAITKKKVENESGVPEVQLVKQIIKWICSQGGTASTDSIVAEFAPKVGNEKNAIFKSILSKIAKFFRAPDKKGYWTIKDEFK